MRDAIPFFLREAVLTLYPAGADGLLITGGAIWSGALANRFQAALDYDEVKLMGSGERFSTAHHVDEETVITIGRSWILPKGGSMNDFKPARNQQYVLVVLWHADGYWYSRIFYGVTGRSVGHDSQGANQFLVNQVFRAQSSVDGGGPDATPVFVPAPTGAPANVAEPFGFFREDPFVNGEYLLGVYAFDHAVTLGDVQFIGLAPSSPVTLALELNGVLTGQTLTVPAATANTEVQASADLGGVGVAAGQNVRWKITDGPAPEDSAWQSALVMQVANQ